MTTSLYFWNGKRIMERNHTDDAHSIALGFHRMPCLMYTENSGLACFGFYTFLGWKLMHRGLVPKPLLTMALVLGVQA